MRGLTLADGLDYWRNNLFYTIILYLLPLALILLIPSMIMTYFMELTGLAIAYFVFSATIIFVALFQNIGITVRKYFFLGLLYIVATSLIFFMGQHGAGITYLFGVTVFALLILPPKAGKITIGVNVGICVLHAFFIYNNMVEYPLRDSFQVISWILISGNSILLSIMAVIFMPMLFSGLQNTIIEQHGLERELRVHQKELENSLTEKETLLAEIHHRVKNNLAVISGLLQLQAFKETDKEFQKKLLDSTLRIKSMAGIHEQLYKAHSFSNISFDEGLINLTQTIIETLGNGDRIHTEFDLDPVELNINQAVPCSLIVNEVVTNSLKHAFENREKGEIAITLKYSSDNVLLRLLDDGSGFDDSTPAEGKTSLGMELIDTLAQQLGADYKYGSRGNGTGTMFELKFTLSNSPGSSSS
ncbi:sensor histidine kinase [Gracilimonas sp.]|uniref:sensor histidine kinase n=1 Tax=Gracilimonas sp. TaxID=1974203 RepID=UPI0028729A5E|nr:sensor histidine kinase [Gracilimonas sp.]